jgi:amphi-Trp domain-containing protein
MADVSFERTKAVSREEAAEWLSALARGFTHGGEVVLPVGGGGTVTLRLPEQVQAEFEVEVTADEVEVELEFTWSLGHPPEPPAAGPPEQD